MVIDRAVSRCLFSVITRMYYVILSYSHSFQKDSDVPCFQQRVHLIWSLLLLSVQHCYYFLLLSLYDIVIIFYYYHYTTLLLFFTIITIWHCFFFFYYHYTTLLLFLLLSLYGIVIIFYYYHYTTLLLFFTIITIRHCYYFLLLSLYDIVIIFVFCIWTRSSENVSYGKCSLISIFVVRCLDSMICILALSKVSRFYLVPVAEQAGLNLTWSKILEDTFSRDVAHMI